MRKVFPSEWRTQSRRKRRFYARYMKWIERAGYVLVAGVLGAFVLAFRYPVDDLVTADKVEIVPHMQPIWDGSDPYFVTRWLVDDFAQVKKDQPVCEAIIGEPGDKEIERWGAIEALREKMGDTPEFRAMVAKLPQPGVRTFTVMADGIFRRMPSPTGWYEDPAGYTVDYNDLRLNATLSGDTIARAEVGQTAKVTGITVDYGTKSIFRGSDGGQSLLSGGLLDGETMDAISSSLTFAPLRVRDDIALTADGVTEVQIDAKVATAPANGGEALPLDPSSDLAVSAKVVEGHASGTVQVTELPASVREKIDAAVRKAVEGREVQRLDGTKERIERVSDIRPIIKVKVMSGGLPDHPDIDATKLSRTYDAELKIDAPPKYLIEAVKRAQMAGKAVTARVELRTGTRPIAFILLKKS